MTDEKTPEDALEPEERVAIETEGRRRRAVAKLVAAVLVALPGSYAAVRAQYAADADKVKTEVVVRDRQEDALRKHVEALRGELAAVRKSSVTHKELLELVVKLRARTRVYRPRSPARRTEATARELELEKKLEALRARGVTAVAAGRKTAAAKRALPKLRPAAAVRKAVEQKLAF